MSWDPYFGYTSEDSHEVVFGVRNSTDFTFERVRSNEHHGHFFSATRTENDFVTPPQFIKPGKIVWMCGVAAMKTMNIELDVTYKKQGDDKELFKLYFSVPYTGKNTYGDTGLRDWCKRDYYIQEYGNFRWNVSGSDSLKVNAAFDVKFHPYRNTTQPTKLQGACQESPAAASLDGKLYLMWQGFPESSTMWYSVGTEGAQNSWTWENQQMCRNNNRQGQEMYIKGSPCLVAWNSKIYLFHQGRDNQILWWNTFEPGKGWGQSQANTHCCLSDSPTAVVYNNQIHLVHQGANNDGSMWHITFDGSNWSQDRRISVHRCTGSPSLVVYNNKLMVYYQGQGNNGELCSGEYENGDWPASTLRKIDKVGMSASPAAINLAGSKWVFVFHQATGGQSGLWVNGFDGEKWEGDTQLGDSEMTLGPKITAIGNRIFLFHQGGPRGRSQIWFKTIRIG